MTLPMAPGTYQLDPLHSQIGFTVTHLSLTPVRGPFPEFVGTLQVGERLEDVVLDVAIRMSSVQSGHPGRDEHIQNPDFFHSEPHPDMTFRSTSVSEAGEGWIVDGDLTVKGTSQPVRLETTMTGRKVFPLDEKEHLGFVARGLLSRSTFGVAVGVAADMLSDDIEIEIAAQLVATEEPG